MGIGRRVAAELLGTLVLVLVGCGAAVVGVDAIGGEPGHGRATGVVVAMAFGLAMAGLVSALGGVSGGHLNPAVTVGMYASGRFPAKEVMPYVLAQTAGGIFGATLLFGVVMGHPDFVVENGFAANGFGELSPSGYGLRGAAIAEAALAFAVVLVTVASAEVRGGRRARGGR
ncbi:MAG: aquaporin [Polyangiaceae bacterium]